MNVEDLLERGLKDRKAFCFALRFGSLSVCAPAAFSGVGKGCV